MLGICAACGEDRQARLNANSSDLRTGDGLHALREHAERDSDHNVSDLLVLALPHHLNIASATDN